MTIYQKEFTQNSPPATPAVAQEAAQCTLCPSNPQHGAHRASPDLSVEALEARRSQRTSAHFFLQPFRQLMRLNGQITIMTTSGKWVAQGQPSYPLPPSTGIEPLSHCIVGPIEEPRSIPAVSCRLREPQLDRLPAAELARQPVFHIALESLQVHSEARFHQAVRHRQGLIKRGATGKASHAEAIQPGDGAIARPERLHDFNANLSGEHGPWSLVLGHFFLAVGRQGQGTNDQGRLCGLTPKKREPVSLGLDFAKFARLRAGRQRLPVDDRLLIFD